MAGFYCFFFNCQKFSSFNVLENYVDPYCCKLYWLMNPLKECMAPTGTIVTVRMPHFGEAKSSWENRPVNSMSVIPYPSQVQSPVDQGLSSLSFTWASSFASLSLKNPCTNSLSQIIRRPADVTPLPAAWDVMVSHIKLGFSSVPAVCGASSYNLKDPLKTTRSESSFILSKNVLKYWFTKLSMSIV